MNIEQLPNATVKAALLFLLTSCVRMRGYMEMPYFGGDAGSVGVQAGATVTVRWQDTLPDGLFYLFVWVGEPTMLMGIDTFSADGISIQWQVPENISGKPFGIALYRDSVVRISALSYLDYSSGDAPPEECVVHYSSNAPEVFDNLPNEAAYHILGYLAGCAPVIEIVDDSEGMRWYRVDLSQPSVINPLDGSIDLPESGWVYGVAPLLGDCSQIPHSTP